MLEAPKVRPPSRDADGVWALLRALVREGRSGEPRGFALATHGYEPVAAEGAPLVIDERLRGGYQAQGPLSRPARELLDLFVPLCSGPLCGALVVAHLAQTLDGRIATRSGCSQFISGQEDLSHTHRLRAICDAVMVGSRTVLHDDPRLTTRHVPGDHPVRVVIDAARCLDDNRSIFRDPTARTLVVVDRAQATESTRVGLAECVPLQREGSGFRPADIVAALAERGIRRLFIEGGGITISGFLECGLLDRLHVTVAPMIMGSGVSAIALEPIDTLAEALRFESRVFTMGRDVLFDCDLRARAWT